MIPNFLSIKDTAKTLQLSVATIRNLIRDKNIPAIKLANRWRIPAEALSQKLNEDALARQAQVAKAPVKAADRLAEMQATIKQLQAKLLTTPTTAKPVEITPRKRGRPRRQSR